MGKRNTWHCIKIPLIEKYMIKHFKTKFKVPRKSHYKKDEQVIETIFKTVGYMS